MQLLRRFMTFFAVLIFAGTADFLFNPSDTYAKHVNNIKVQSISRIHSHAYAVKKHAKLYTGVSFKHYIPAKHYLRTVWYRERLAKLTVNGKKKSAFQLRSANNKYTYWVFHSQVKGIACKSFKIALPAAGKRFVHKRIGVFGDSIPSGWDGYHFYLNDSYPDWTRKYLGSQTKLQNEAVPNAQIVGHEYRYVGGKYNKIVPRDISVVLKHNRKRIKSMNIIFVHAGTNDYTNWSGAGSLTNVSRHLYQEIRYIRKANPKAKVYGILPISRFGNYGQNCGNLPNMYGYTLNQLRRVEAAIYKSLGATVVDFDRIAPGVITAANRTMTLQDHKIHPTTRTAQKLGYYLAKWLIR